MGIRVVNPETHGFKRGRTLGRRGRAGNFRQLTTTHSTSSPWRIRFGPDPGRRGIPARDRRSGRSNPLFEMTWLHELHDIALVHLTPHVAFRVDRKKYFTIAHRYLFRTKSIRSTAP